MSPFGKAYVAFTAVGQGGHDVRSAYYYAGSWGVESAPLDANPVDNAGIASGCSATPNLVPRYCEFERPALKLQGDREFRGTALFRASKLSITLEHQSRSN